MVLLRDGISVAESSAEVLQVSAPGPGAYRVEVSVPRSPGTHPVPWIVTNPIHLIGPQPLPLPSPTFVSVMPLTEPGTIEKDAESVATLTTGDDGSLGSGVRRLVVEYRLGARPRGSHYAAVAVRVPDVRPLFDAVGFSARSSAPMRVSVQLRFDSLRGARWGRSVYVSPELAGHFVRLDQLVSLDGHSTPPQLTSASSVLFVVDLTNASPGGAGRFEITDLNLLSIASANR
jgi:hypothetical protein